MKGKTQNEMTLLDVLIDAFEKNEVMDGFHWRDLPMPDEQAARAKFTELATEGRAWKGAPVRESESNESRRLAVWSDLEIRQLGRGIMVRARAPWLSAWWHAADTWRDDPIGPIHDWIAEERAGRD